MHRQTRIFAPFNSAYPPEHWYENILGRIIKPVTDKWGNLDWFWFSRYIHPLGIYEDCDVSQVVGIYLDNNNNNITRSIRFRFSINDAYCGKFEKDFKSIIQNNDCLITDFRPWDKVGDVGSGRHIGGQITEERRHDRAERNTRLYHQISLLTLDVLEGPDASNNYRMEENISVDIPNHQRKSSFSTPHHLFCNITQIPLSASVNVVLQNGNLSLRTETGWGVPGEFSPTPMNVPINIDINMPTIFG